MTKMFSRRKILCLVLSVLAIAGMMESCEKVEERDPCLQPKTMSLRMRTLRPVADTGTAVTDTALQFAALVPVGGQTGFVFQSQSRWSLFLSPHADSCQYVISTDTFFTPEFLDTLTFRYDRQTQFLSNACGYTYFFTLRSVNTTTNRLDSVRISVAEVTNDANAEHVQLFYAR